MRTRRSNFPVLASQFVFTFDTLVGVTRFAKGTSNLGTWNLEPGTWNLEPGTEPEHERST
jgi:hypothetical protein